MAIPAEHLAQVKHNLALFRHLTNSAGTVYLDWQVIALFYAALHLVDAYFVQAAPGRQRPTGHRNRGHQVRLLLPAIYDDYRRLQDRSESARYDLRQFTQAEVDGFFSGEFTRIRAEVRTALGLAL